MIPNLIGAPALVVGKPRASGDDPTLLRGLESLSM